MTSNEVGKFAKWIQYNQYRFATIAAAVRTFRLEDMDRCTDCPHKEPVVPYYPQPWHPYYPTPWTTYRPYDYQQITWTETDNTSPDQFTYTTFNV